MGGLMCVFESPDEVQKRQSESSTEALWLKDELKWFPISQVVGQSSVYRKIFTAVAKVQHIVSLSG